MYTTHFGLNRAPFSLLPDPSFLYGSKQHDAAFTLLEYALVHQAGYVVICGEIGSGKTTLMHHLLNQVGANVNPAFITNTHASFGSLLQWILMQFDLQYAQRDDAERYQTLVDYLIRIYGEGRRSLLIIDEAQNLSLPAIEQLRMLSNINSHDNLVLQVILVGQPQLLDVLRRPELTQFVQRVSADYFIEGLSFEDTVKYIRHRLSIAGGKPSTFRGDSHRPIFSFSKGIPRLINQICDAALVYAYGAGRKTVDADIVAEVVRDRTSRRGLWMPDREPAAAMADGSDSTPLAPCGERPES